MASSTHRPPVDFIVIGAHKSATTSVCDLLHQHPKLFICDPKEPNFFAHDKKWNHGLDWYGQLFANCPAGCLRGDGSTNYTMNLRFPATAQRIYDSAPAAKLIYLARHPIARIESHWLFVRKTGGVIDSDINLAVDNNELMVDISLYHKQIQSYLQLFPREQIHVEFFEDFKSQPTEVLQRICNFLQVEPLDFGQSNASAPRNASVGQLGDSLTLMRIRKIPGALAIRNLLPDFCKNLLKKKFKTKLEKPIWRPEVRQRLVDTIAPDSRQFLATFNKPQDYWDLDKPS